MSEISNQQSQISNQQSNWFASWFDTKYYHILYKERNYREAQVFMDNLTHYLNLPEKAKVLDLACGKGRHSIYLNQLGFNVLGVDLSGQSIEIASKNSNDNLHFKVHDMRKPLGEKFDAIFNLFTSFGYFESDQDNIETLISIKESLTEYGFAVIDFMNSNYVIENLVADEVKTVDGIDFHIQRFIENGFIKKDITFNDNGESFHFIEKVRAFTLEDFSKMMSDNDINLLDVFGDIKLNKYHKNTSERLIMIFK